MSPYLLEWLFSKTQRMTIFGKDVKEGKPCPLFLGYKLVQLLWKTVWKFLKNLRIVLPCDLAIPLPSKPEEERNQKHLTWKDIRNCGINHNTQDMETSLAIDELMN